MTSRKVKRIEALANALEQRRFVHLKDAARLVGASEMTVRRDIGQAGDRFVFLGGHIMLADAGEDAVGYHLATAADAHAQAKREACRHAARHVRPHETIFIDCGTTLVHLADVLPGDMPITVVCYALNIANKLADRPNLTLVLLGGLYHSASASFSDWNAFDGLAVNVAFLSAAGVDGRRGATCEHFHEARIKQKAIDVARERFLVVDRSKFGRMRRAFFAPLDKFDAVITEDGETGVEPDRSDPG